MNRKIAWILGAAASIGGTGCVGSSGAYLWDPHDTCAKDPKAYEALQEFYIADEAGTRLNEVADPRAAAILRVERRDCMFRVVAARGVKTGTFGPYEGLQLGEQMVAGGHGKYTFVGKAPKGYVVVIDGVESEPHEAINQPMYSANKAHMAYLAKDGDTGSLWVDGKSIAKGAGPGEPDGVLGVLDDGRAVYQTKTVDSRRSLHVGSWESMPFDNISYSSIWRGERFSAFLQRGTRWEAVLDARTETLDGPPAGTAMFSPDGAHAAFLVYRGDLPQKRHDLVIDGVATPLPSIPNGTPTVVFHGSVPVLYIYPPPPPSSGGSGIDSGLPPPVTNNETGYLVVGARTPAAPPTADEYTQFNAGRTGQYVQIGSSRGPQFDGVVLDSLRIDEQGRVHYRARRRGDEYAVVDNVIQRLPLRDGQAGPSAPAKVAAPDTPAPSATVAAPDAKK